MDYQALAIDLDGTLLIGESLPAENRDAIAKAAAAGLKIIIATARWRHMAERIAAEIGISAPIIACSGAQVYLPEENRDIFDHRLSDGFVAAAFELFDTERCVATVSGDDETLLKLDGEPDPALLSPEMRWVTSLRAEKGFRPRIATVQGSRVVATVKESLKPAWSEQVNIYDSIGPSGKIILTMTAREANKGEALGAACAHLGIDPLQVITFGDAENDVSMFERSGASVAMGQADDSVKQAASHVTASNTDNGVAQAVTHLLANGDLDGFNRHPGR